MHLSAKFHWHQGLSKEPNLLLNVLLCKTVFFSFHFYDSNLKGKNQQKEYN